MRWLYPIARPGEALLIKGWRIDGHRVVEGGAFVPPVLRQVHRFPLNPSPVEVRQDCLDREFVAVFVRVEVSYRMEDVAKAGGWYARNPEEMPAKVRSIFKHHLGSVTGTMTFQDITVQGRDQFAAAVVESAKSAMERIGLACDSLDVLEAYDQQGLAEALSGPQRLATTWASLGASIEVHKRGIGQVEALFAGESARLADGRTVAKAAEDSITSRRAEILERVEPTLADNGRT